MVLQARRVGFREINREDDALGVTGFEVTEDDNAMATSAVPAVIRHVGVEEGGEGNDVAEDDSVGIGGAGVEDVDSVLDVASHESPLADLEVRHSTGLDFDGDSLANGLQTEIGQAGANVVDAASDGVLSVGQVAGNGHLSVHYGGSVRGRELAERAHAREACASPAGVVDEAEGRVGEGGVDEQLSDGDLTVVLDGGGQSEGVAGRHGILLGEGHLLVHGQVGRGLDAEASSAIHGSLSVEPERADVDSGGDEEGAVGNQADASVNADGGGQDLGLEEDRHVGGGALQHSEGHFDAVSDAIRDDSTGDVGSGSAVSEDGDRAGHVLEEGMQLVDEVEGGGTNVLNEGLDEEGDRVSNADELVVAVVRGDDGSFAAGEEAEELFNSGGSALGEGLEQAEAVGDGHGVDGQVDLRRRVGGVGDEHAHGTEAAEDLLRSHGSGDGREVSEVEDEIVGDGGVPLQVHSLRVGSVATSVRPGFNADDERQVSVEEAQGEGSRSTSASQVNTTQTSLDEVDGVTRVGVTVPLDFSEAVDLRVGGVLELRANNSVRVHATVDVNADSLTGRGVEGCVDVDDHIAETSDDGLRAGGSGESRLGIQELTACTRDGIGGGSQGTRGASQDFSLVKSRRSVPERREIINHCTKVLAVKLSGCEGDQAGES